MNNKSRWQPAILLLLLSAMQLTACVSTQQAVYFNDRSSEEIEAMAASIEPVLRPGDLVSITVSSLNPESSIVYNSPNLSAAPSTQGNNSTLSQATGYLVNPDGTIQFPVLGNLKAAGLRKQQLREEITRQLAERKLLVDPIVTVRYLNFRVTVIGEVARPGVIPVPSEQISILEALGLAGDLTIYGRRDNVLLIRQEEDGRKVMKTLNLNETATLRSPYYNLKSNDVIYVEPNTAKIATRSRGQQVLPLILSGLSFTAIIIDRIIR